MPNNNLLGLNRLLAITKDCRSDMHEPDEQGLKCRVIGDHLDNAFGNYISIEQLTKGFQEYIVIIERFDGDKFHFETFNLANLIALARQAPDQQPKGSDNE